MTGLRVAISLSLGLSSGFSAVFLVGNCAHAQAPTIKLVSFLAQVASNQATSVVLHVNPVAGNNDTADGSDRAPFKTITHALQVAQPNTVILLAPGTYSAETGEIFPIALQPRVTIQGNPETRGEEVIIRGGGSFASPILAQKSITILGGANQATLVGVTVTNPDPGGYGIQIESSSPTITDSTFTKNGRGGIVVVGKSAPMIRNNFFSQNGADGISIHHTSRPTIQENIFEQTGSAIAISQSAAPLITGNRITQNKDGIVVQDKAQPKLRDNSVEGNEQDGLVAIADSRPDLGTASDPGGNFFRNNGQYDINTEKTSQVITAFGNELIKTVGNLRTRETTAVSTPLTPVTESPTPVAIAPSTVAPKFPPPNHIQTTNPPSVPIAIAPPPVDPEPPLPNRVQKAPPAAPKPSTTPSQTPIPFGTQLSLSPNRDKASDKPVPPSSRQSTEAAIPIKLLDRNSVANRQDNPQWDDTPVLTKQPDRTSAIPFPTPADLSKDTSRLKETPRPIQIVRMATTPQHPLPSPTVVVTPVAAVTTPKPIKPAITEIPSPTPKEIAPPPSPAVSLVYVKPSPAQKISPSTSTLKPSTSTPAIAIPVPPPESGAVPPPIQKMPPALTVASPLALMTNSHPTAAANLLPVPSSNIPVGTIGDMSSVYVSRVPSRQTNVGPPSPPNQAGSVVRYRVVVDANDDDQQEQVRSLIPDAFPVSYQGRTVLQVGAFGDRAKATQLAETLASRGLQASIELLE